jgi:hypothetical protein
MSLVFKVNIMTILNKQNLTEPELLKVDKQSCKLPSSNISTDTKCVGSVGIEHLGCENNGNKWRQKSHPLASMIRA